MRTDTHTQSNSTAATTKGYTLHPAQDRGRTEMGWLDARHSFSFGRYVDRARMGFRSLRVINDDRIAPGGGFGEHPHDNMEIISYIVAGGLAHKDSLGNGATIRPGQIQRMSAGTGVRHAEFNPSDTETARLLQIWIIPDRQGVEPSYEDVSTGVHDRPGELVTIVAPVDAPSDDNPGAVRIHQDAFIQAVVLLPGQSVARQFGDARFGWVQVVRGDLSITVDGEMFTIGEGDAVELDPGASITLTGVYEAELLVFDLA